MNDQVLLSATLIALLGLFIWGKVRYDALAIGALFVLVVLEIIPANDAFSGFAHPAVVTVALVLIISQGLKNSGLTGLVGKLIGTRTFTEFQFLVCLLFIAAILSSFINNIGALAILLPITLNICQKMEWHASKFLMPLAFACILGGMNTAIGTPPNIIISEYKATISSSGFNFFDFSYVGIVITLLSILFIALLGNKFILLRNTGSKTEHLINLKGYLFEVCVNDGSSAIGMTLYKFKKQAGEDFYFLNKVRKMGSVIQLEGNPIQLETRTSSRTPFGTGSSIQKIIHGSQCAQNYKTPFYSFIVLRIWLKSFEILTSSNKELTLHKAASIVIKNDDKIKEAFNKYQYDKSFFLTKAVQIIEPFYQQVFFLGKSRKKQLNQAFHTTFDGLKTRQLINEAQKNFKLL